MKYTRNYVDYCRVWLKTPHFTKAFSRKWSFIPKVFLLLLEKDSKCSWDWFWRKCSSWRKYCVLENTNQSKYPPPRTKGSLCFSGDALKFISSIYLLLGQLIPNLITGVHKVCTEEAAIAHFTNVINLFLIPPEWNRGLRSKVVKCMPQQEGFSLSVHCSTEDFTKNNFSFTTFPWSLGCSKEKPSNWCLGGVWSPFFGNGFDCTRLN